MKKSVGFLLLVFLFALLLMNGEALAFANGVGQVAPYAGVSYNTYAIDGSEWEPEDWDDFELDDSVGSGVGFYAGANYWLAEDALSNLAVGGEFDWLGRAELEDEDISAESTTFGLLATVSYDLSNELGDLPVDLYLSGAAGLYQANFDLEDPHESISEVYRGPGIKAGIQTEYSVQENLDLGGRLHYRYAQPHSEGDLNYNGLEAGLQVGFSF